MTTSPHAATLQHIDLLNAKIAKLTHAQVLAELQVLTRLSADHRAGRIDIEELFEMFQWFKARDVGGFIHRWNEHFEGEYQSRRIRHTRDRVLRTRPDDDGNWRGTWPMPDRAPAPPFGQSVVYVLFDAENVPCYVGSSEQLRTRLRAHDSDGKQFVHWLAYPCRDRQDAFELEDRLLREHKPYLNRKARR